MATGYDAFRDAVTSANSIQTPSSPLGDFPSLRSLYQSSFQLPLAAKAAGAGTNLAATDVANSDAAARASKQQRVDEIQAKIQSIKDMADPSKYQKVAKQDGGFDFFAPNGEKITVGQYAQVTGKPVQKTLEDSQNSSDQQFVRDYGQLQDVLDSLFNKSKADSLKKNNPDLFNKTKGLKPEELIKQFRDYYGNIYQGYGSPDTTRQPQDQLYTPGKQSNPVLDFLSSAFGIGG